MELRLAGALLVNSPMSRTVLVALLLAPTAAAAAPAGRSGATIGGSVLTFEPGPGMEPVGGQLGGWLGYAPGALYVGGEITVGTATRGHEDVAFSYQALAGVRGHPSPRTTVLLDGGLGVSQQIDFDLGLFGTEANSETKAWAPSAAARVGLVGELGQLSGIHLGLALTGDARSTLDADAALALGVGVGFIMTN
jgi:hypothetical protein